MAEMLHLLCTQRWDIEVTAVTHGAATGLAAVTATQPDLVLLDLGLPDLDGLTLLPRLRAAAAHSRIIILTSLCNEYVLGRLQRSAWEGLLDKSTDGLALLGDAIHNVTGGRRYISPTVRQLFRQFQDSSNPITHMLSEREKEALACIAQALTDGEMARRMGIDESTAHSHRKALFRKLDQHSTPKLMHYAIRHGFASLPLPPLPGKPRHPGGPAAAGAGDEPAAASALGV